MHMCLMYVDSGDTYQYLCHTCILDKTLMLVHIWCKTETIYTMYRYIHTPSVMYWMTLFSQIAYAHIEYVRIEYIIQQSDSKMIFNTNEFAQT
jgi:hypothetical protein